jgi:hypothetical protein
MTWRRGPVATALAAVFAAADPAVSVFETAPGTINAPALICTDPSVVVKRTAGMGVDQTEFIVTAAVGLDQADEMSDLLDVADRAIFADPTLGGVVQTAVVVEYRNYRPLQVGGADFRAADLAVRIDM